MEARQVKFIRHMLGITRLDHQNIQKFEKDYGFQIISVTLKTKNILLG
jgi:hypothetical protein